MTVQIIIRFLIGGLVVSVFAVLGDMLKPKSFAGLFGAAPSVAIATLGLTVIANGKLYAAGEARSMIAGSAALLVYTWLVCQALMRRRWNVLAVACFSIPVWFIAAFGIWRLFLASPR
jgi:hypothetical protein